MAFQYTSNVLVGSLAIKAAPAFSPVASITPSSKVLALLGNTPPSATRRLDLAAAQATVAAPATPFDRPYVCLVPGVPGSKDERGCLAVYLRKGDLVLLHDFYRVISFLQEPNAIVPIGPGLQVISAVYSL